MSHDEKNTFGPLFLRLFVAHQKSIYAYILAMVHDYVDAEDILQETSVIMWEKFGNYQPDTDFIAWGITIARFQVLKYTKLRSRSKVQFNNDVLKAIEDCTESQLAHIDRRMQALRHCRRKLNEQDRTLVEMKFDRGIPLKKIAENTGRSIHAIYKKMSRIQDVLLRCIDRTINAGLLPK